MTVPLHQQGIEQLSDYFQRRPGSRSLNHEERQALRMNGARVSAAWSTMLSVDDKEVELLITVDETFPYTCPRIIVSKDHYLKYPHVERDGGLCLLTAEASFSHVNPPAVLDALLKDAAELLAKGYSGENRDDFIDEFENYWEAYAPPDYPSVYSLIDPTPPTRSVYVMTNGKQKVIGGSIDECRAWIEKRGFDLTRVTGHKAVFLWLNHPLFPDDYPKRGFDVRQMLEVQAPGLFDLFIAKLPQELTSCLLPFGFTTNNGPALGAIQIWPTLDRKGRPNIAGFRKGKVPPFRLAGSYLSSNKVDCLPMKRVDPSWIHARGGRGLYDVLKGKKVCIIGCGSLGADVALLLAKAGVERMLLIDGDRLTWDNIGRHLLGADCIGMRKDKALAQYLQKQLPHISIDYGKDSANWQAVHRKDPSLLTGQDLIISMTAHWSSNDHLNRVARKSPSFPPLVFGWFESHACAGHALAVMDIGGCLNCGMDDLGHFLCPVTGWESSTLHRAPACGAYYQPYGAVETLPVKMLVVETALDVLLNKIMRSELRTWIGNAGSLQNYGGTWSQEWIEKHGDPGDGKVIIGEAWPINPACTLCN